MSTVIPELVSGGAAQVSMKVERNGVLLLVADVSAMKYEVWQHSDTGADTQTADQVLTPAAVIFDTPLATGRNVRYDIAAAGAFPAPGLYEIVTEFTLQGGALFRHVTRRRFRHAPS